VRFEVAGLGNDREHRLGRIGEPASLDPPEQPVSHIGRQVGVSSG
jgi:hypothetical protein